MTALRGDAPQQRWGIGESAIGLIAAVIFMISLTTWLRTTPFYDGHLVLLLSYAIVWVPFLIAIGIACFLRGTRSLARDIGLRVTPLDVLLGLGTGLLARAIAGVIEIAFTGHMVGLGVTFGDTTYDGWWVFGTILAPVLLGPFVEELFFRGLLQRALLRAGSRRLSAPAATTLALIASACLFALLHLTQAANPTGAAVLGLSSFAFGLGAALLVGLTGRVGGAIVAHIVFNGSLVAASLL